MTRGKSSKQGSGCAEPSFHVSSSSSASCTDMWQPENAYNASGSALRAEISLATSDGLS